MSKEFLPDFFQDLFKNFPRSNSLNLSWSFSFFFLEYFLCFLGFHQGNYPRARFEFYSRTPSRSQSFLFKFIQKSITELLQYFFLGVRCENFPEFHFQFSHAVLAWISLVISPEVLPGMFPRSFSTTISQGFFLGFLQYFFP